MRIKRIELASVRRLRAVQLDLAAPITLIGGPNGSCKTTLQQALLHALFHKPRGDHQELISRFDPQSPPRVTLHLECGPEKRSVRLVRQLTSDAGEWHERGAIQKRKGLALERIKELLPLDLEAAATLLWGLQDDLAHVLENFPPSGHSLLTNAVIRGSGPDPKAVVEKLEKEIKGAQKRGQDPGPLTRAAADVAQLDSELAAALEAERQLASLRQQHADAKKQLDELRQRKTEHQLEIRQAIDLRRLLEEALRAQVDWKQLQERQKQWDGLDEEIRIARQALQHRLEEQQALQVRRRVALDRELLGRIALLRQQLQRVAEAEQVRAAREKELLARPRPVEADVKAAQSFDTKLQTHQASLDATGVRYVVSAREPTTVRIAADGGPVRECTLAVDQPLDGVVGQIVLESGNLRLSAAGKADVAAVKRAMETVQQERAAFWSRFQVADAREFAALVEETRQLRERLAAAEKQRDQELKGATPAALRDQLANLEQELQALAVTDAERQACRDLLLGSAVELGQALAQKNGEVAAAQGLLRDRETRRPAPEQVAESKRQLVESSSAVRLALAALEQLDPTLTEPTEQHRKALDARIDSLRKAGDDLDSRIATADRKVTTLGAQLSHVGATKPLASIEAELADARERLSRETTLQKARELLQERIAQKISELAAEVPPRLGVRVGEYFSRLTNGFFDQVTLTDQLVVSRLREVGTTPQQQAEHWETQHLSTGERHQAALALKIALARALTESHGPIFVILDDYLVHFDPSRRAATEQLLQDLTRDGLLQVILLTCHTDWAVDWQRRHPQEVEFVDLPSTADYYRPPTIT
jgi:DNA repair exonuclease SbcCD ATPase subunit